MKRLLALLVLLLTAGSAACLNTESLDRYGYVLGIGFDQGEKLPFRITLMLQNTKPESDNQANGGFTLVDAECRSVYEAIETLSASLPYQLNFVRTQLVVMDRALLTGKAEDNPLTDTVITRLRIRSNVYLFCALSSANEVLSGLKSELDPSFSRLQQNIGYYAGETGLIPMTTFASMMEAERTARAGEVMPLCGVIDDQQPEKAAGDSVGNREYPYLGGSLLVKSGMKTGLAGAALLKKGKLVGLLCGQNVQLLLMAGGKFEKGRTRFEGEGGGVEAAFLKKEPPSVTFTLGTVPKAVVTIPLTAVVESYGQMGEERPEDWLARRLSKDTDALFACCRALGVDAFGFGRYAAGQFRTGAEWEAFDWAAAYANMEAAFVYEISIQQRMKKEREE